VFTVVLPVILIYRNTRRSFLKKILIDFSAKRGRAINVVV